MSGLFTAGSSRPDTKAELNTDRVTSTGIWDQDHEKHPTGTETGKEAWEV